MWYSWVAPADGSVSIDTLGSTFDTVLAVYVGESLSELRLIAADDDGANFNHNSQLVFNCIAGTRYRIVIDGFSGASGAVAININPVLAIVSETIASNSSLKMQIFAPALGRVVMETSTDLQTWSAVSTNASAADGILSLTVNTALKPSAFFRARLLSER